MKLERYILLEKCSCLSLAFMLTIFLPKFDKLILLQIKLKYKNVALKFNIKRNIEIENIKKYQLKS